MEVFTCFVFVSKSSKSWKACLVSKQQLLVLEIGHDINRVHDRILGVLSICVKFYTKRILFYNLIKHACQTCIVRPRRLLSRLKIDRASLREYSRQKSSKKNWRTMPPRLSSLMNEDTVSPRLAACNFLLAQKLEHPVAPRQYSAVTKLLYWSRSRRLSFILFSIHQPIRNFPSRKKTAFSSGKKNDVSTDEIHNSRAVLRFSFRKTLEQTRQFFQRSSFTRRSNGTGLSQRVATEHVRGIWLRWFPSCKNVQSSRGLPLISINVIPADCGSLPPSTF